MQTPLIALLIVTIAGVAVASQTPINAALARAIGSGVGAATVSFGVGFVVLLGLSFAIGQGGALLQIGTAPPFLLVGGALGAFYVWAVLWAIPSLGALTTITALILGQMTAALVIDATGLFGLAVQAITPTRIAAASLVGAGVVLSRL